MAYARIYIDDHNRTNQKHYKPMYILNYNEDIIEKESRTIPFANLDDAKRILREYRDQFISECDFMDCIEVEKDTPTHYEATDGEDWITIQISQTLD